MTASLTVNGAELLCDCSGALFWPGERTLVVADLHLEKGSSYAASGQLLPPYDTAATLRNLGRLIESYGPARVIALGDSFHDPDAAARIAREDTATLRSLTARADWIWITGNHDPSPPVDWGGMALAEVSLGPLAFRHESKAHSLGGEVSGHFHPKASVRVRQRRLTTRCFVTDGQRLILPAFGAYTGGLNVLDPAISDLFPKGFLVNMLGRNGLYRYPRHALAA